MLGAEHANVLDEIDLLRGKLSQLEQSVLTAAAVSTTAPGGGPTGNSSSSGGGGAVAAGMGGNGASGGGGAGGLAADVAALLASLGLGEEATGMLAGVGVGPRESWGEGPGFEGRGTDGGEEGGAEVGRISSSSRGSAALVPTAIAPAGGGGVGGSLPSPRSSARSTHQGAALGSSRSPEFGGAAAGGYDMGAGAGSSSINSNSSSSAGMQRPLVSPSRQRLPSPMRSGGAGSMPEQRPLLSPNRPSAGLRPAGGNGAGGTNVAAAAKNLIGRSSPLLGNRGSFLGSDGASPEPDAIIVADAAKLAALLSSDDGALGTGAVTHGGGGNSGSLVRASSGSLLTSAGAGRKSPVPPSAPGPRGLGLRAPSFTGSFGSQSQHSSNGGASSPKSVSFRAEPVVQELQGLGPKGQASGSKIGAGRQQG